MKRDRRWQKGSRNQDGIRRIARNAQPEPEPRFDAWCGSLCHYEGNGALCDSPDSYIGISCRTSRVTGVSILSLGYFPGVPLLQSCTSVLPIFHRGIEMDNSPFFPLRQSLVLSSLRCLGGEMRLGEKAAQIRLAGWPDVSVSLTFF